MQIICFPGGISGKGPTCQCRRCKRPRLDSLIGGRHPGAGGGHGSPLQYSCLENPMDRGAWWATVHRVARSQTRLKQLSTHACVHSVNNTYHYRKFGKYEEVY